MFGTSSEQQRRCKQQAASIRRLNPCKTEDGSFKATIKRQWCQHQSQPASAGNLKPVCLSNSNSCRRRNDDKATLGQAAVFLPGVAGADVCIALPPALAVTATHHGVLDCRLQLLGFTAEWPATRQQQQQQHQVYPARSPAAGFAVRCGALLLSQVLFPNHTNRLLTYLAAPVAAADVLAAVNAAVPAAAKQAIKHKASRVKQRLQPWGQKLQQQEQQRGSDPTAGGGYASGVGVGVMHAAVGLLSGSMHALRCLSGPSAAVACAGWLWCVLHPSSVTLLSGLVALVTTAADYQQLGRDIALGRHAAAGRHTEALWHARHKRAAQRLAPYCNELPVHPPLRPVIKLAQCCSIAAGLRVQGQPLCGAVAASSSSNDAADLGIVGHHGVLGSNVVQQQQLVISGSFLPTAYAAGSSKQHDTAGLDRAQLLELFTGYADGGQQCSAAAVGCKADSSTEPTVCSGSVATRQGSSKHAGSSSSIISGSCTGSRLACALHASSAGSSSSSGQIATCTSSGSRESQHKCLTVDEHHKQQEQQVSLEIPVPVVHCCPSVASTPSTATAAAAAGGGTDCLTAASYQRCIPSSSSSSSSSGADASADPLEFLDSLPLFGREDHHDASLSSSSRLRVGSQGWLPDLLLLCVRGVHLLLLFSPFMLLGVPMLLLAWYLMTRAQQQQQRTTGYSSQMIEQQQSSPGSSISSSWRWLSVRDFKIRSLTRDGSHGRISGNHEDQITGLIKIRRSAARIWHHISHPSVLLHNLLHQLLLLLSMLCAVLDVLVVLLLGGRWSSGLDVWLSAGLWLRGRCWRLLLLSCRWSGAAFIKWAQWSSSRRDIFPADFCDTLAELHDRAPSHSFRHTRREVESAFGVPLHQLFDTFDQTPLASGSVAQVHRATLRRKHALAALAAARHGSSSSRQQSANTANSNTSSKSCSAADPDGGCADGCDLDDLRDDHDDPIIDVVVKVCHPGVSDQISRDFRLLSGLSAAAARLPALRGLSLRESVSQFSHTMTAQTDLRVEATHALRFYNNFAGVKSSVSIPKPIPGLVHERVLVETFEGGDSVATYMRSPSAINTQIVALGVDTYLKMLLKDNFVHTDLHPGNILVRAVPARHKQKQMQKVQSSGGTCDSQQQQQHQQRPWWRFWRRGNTAAASTAGAAVADDINSSCPAGVVPEQWETDLQRMAEQQRSKWSSQHATTTTTTSSSSTAQQIRQSADHIDHDDKAGEGTDDVGGCSAQLVLLDFGLAEELTPEVRFHFIRFLTAIAAGNGLAAAHHLLRWSHNQTCLDRSAFTADIIDLFEQQCDIQSAEGIDLDAVIKVVLVLARKHHVSIDSCYASLVLSVCVLVGFAKALDPGVNLMDAATPALLTYALTGEVVGRLYST